MVAFTEGKNIDVKDLGIIRHENRANINIQYKGMTLKEIESVAIKEALNTADNNMSKAAKLFGVGRTKLWRKIKEV